MGKIYRFDVINVVTLSQLKIRSRYNLEGSERERYLHTSCVSPLLVEF
jgi:hypothetical protein